MHEMTTCWDLLAGAAAGDRKEEDDFCERYRPLIANFLGRRWRMRLAAQDIEDAVQETLMECVKEGGVLARVDRSSTRSFRAFLYGVTTNVARRFEERAQRAGRLQAEPLPPSKLAPAEVLDPREAFDRAWAAGVLSQARRLLEERARGADADSRRRCELLDLRFNEGLPIRTIAARWDVPAESLHREYAKARVEFKDALEETLRFENQNAPLDLDAELRELLELSSSR